MADSFVIDNEKKLTVEEPSEDRCGRQIFVEILGEGRISRYIRMR
jgi:hypothetical protein